MRGAFILLASICAGLASRAAADESPICPDRPGKATSACTVPSGKWQVETGLADWTLQNSNGERDTSLVLGETTFKRGLTDRSDIELDVTFFERQSTRTRSFHESASGFGDLRVIYKQMLTSGSSPVQIVAMPFVKVPTAKDPLGNGRWEGGFLVPIGYAIPKSPFSLGFTPQIDWVSDADGAGHHPAMAQVATLGWQVSSKLNLTAELWGQWDWDPSGTTRQASADGSIAYLLSKDMQLDAGANFGLNHNTPDLELYTGVSKRF